MSENEQQQQTAFCLKEIENSKTLILTLSARFPKIRAAYEKYKGTGLKREYDSLVDLGQAVKRLLEEFPALVLQLNEYGDEELSKTTERLYGVLKKFNYLGTTDYSKLCMALESFAKGLPTADHNINTAKLAHLMNRARMGYFPTDLSHVQMLKDAIVFPGEPVNLIDPCCGEGLALQAFSKGVQARTYGIEIDEVRGEEAQRRLQRVGFGSFFHSRISLNAFQGLWLNPPYLSVPSENGSRRLEKSFLADSMRLLQVGGIMIYIIPYYRATPDVCRVLCENFTDLRVHKFIGKEFERFKQVAIIGRRIERREAEKWLKSYPNICWTPTKSP
ncbi:MAG: class I SAM-dependent methyltransferase [Clostridiales bacterium]|nr:class I SAM-dependent methyltransferase [Clostridiales bacterium]